MEGTHPTRRLAARTCAVLLLCAVALGGCLGPARDPAKRRLIDDVLHERAAHLDAPTRSRIARSFLDAESRHGVDALLLLAVAEQESHFRVDARGRRGALGLMQVRPATAREVADRHGMRWRGEHQLRDPVANIRIAAAYLADLKQRFGSWEATLTAYNRGPSRVRAADARGSPVGSRYATRVLARYRKLEARYGRDAG